MRGNQYFIPPSPDPKDRRPRNAFGFLVGFGKAAKAYYAKRDKTAKKKAKATKKRMRRKTT